MSISFLYGAFQPVSKPLALGILSLSLTSFSAAAQPVVVAALGDSLTQGFGVPQGQGFVPQLEAWLADQGLDVVVQNAGVSGDTTQGGLARVDWTLGSDVDAMIVALGGNDALRGIDPAVSKANLAGIMDAAQAADVEVLLVGLEAPLNFGAEYKAAFDRMYGDLAQSYDAALAPDFFEGIRDLPAQELGSMMQGDGIHPNATGVSAIVDALGPYVQQLVESVADQN